MSNIDWSQLRTEYENGASLRTLAAKYNVSKSVIGERKHKEQWTERTDSRTRPNMQEVVTRDVNAGNRAALALKLRSQKNKYDDIAKMCGYASAGAAHKAVQRELQRTIVTNVEELRREELDSLERLELECWKRLDDKAYEKGKLFAVDRILVIKDRRAKLLGLDIKPDDALSANLVVIREVPAGLLSEPNA